MALSVVRKGQSGSGASSSVPTEGTTATAGNLLIASAGQINTLNQITFSDDKGGGWTTIGTTIANNDGGVEYGTGSSGWIGYKIAAGGEKEVKATPGAGGTLEGINYVEVSGLGNAPTVDSIVAHHNVVSSKEDTTGALTTAEAEELIFASVFSGAAATNAISAWTGTGVLNNISTASSRIIGGYFVTAAKWTANTATAHWETAKATGSLIVAFKATPEAATGHVVTVT